MTRAVTDLPWRNYKISQSRGALPTAPLVLTPHPGEFARLTGRDAADIQADRQKAAQEAIDTWQEAFELLVNWANRASHGGSLSLTEANRLINVCSASLDFFKCTNPDCGTPVWRTLDGDRKFCRCRNLRWDT